MRLQYSLDEITRLLEKHRVLEGLIHMTHEWIAVPDTYTINRALSDLRSRGELPPQTDRLFVAATAGVAIPFGLHATGRDPAYGSSVLLTFITDAMGFFLFLGLAALFLS
jgi:Mg/Co/Ni transporter MgtE